MSPANKHAKPKPMSSQFGFSLDFFFIGNPEIDPVYRTSLGRGLHTHTLKHSAHVLHDSLLFPSASFLGDCSFSAQLIALAKRIDVECPKCGAQSRIAAGRKGL